MTIFELIEILNLEVLQNIRGEFRLDGATIQWHYDCGNDYFEDDVEDYLTHIFEEDFEIINEFLEEEEIEVETTIPEIIDNTIYVYMEF